MLFKIGCMFFVLCICHGGVAVSQDDVGQDAGEQDSAEQAQDGSAEIEAAIQSYVTAFNARDAQKLAEHWSPEGVYISRSSGDQVVGRESLTEEFTAEDADVLRGLNVRVTGGPAVAGAPATIRLASFQTEPPAEE